MKSEESNLPDRITYSESRTVNIGNYENVNMFLCIGCNIRHFNRIDKTIEISHSESANLDDMSSDIENTANLIITKTKKILNSREHQIRLATETYVDFNGLDKMVKAHDNKKS